MGVLLNLYPSMNTQAHVKKSSNIAKDVQVIVLIVWMKIGAHLAKIILSNITILVLAIALLECMPKKV